MRLIKEVLYTFLFAFVFFLLWQFSLDTRGIPSSSMEPNLKIGERVLVNKLVYQKIDWLGGVIPAFKERVYLFHPPRRGEIVIFHPRPDAEDVWIKRVIGMPGDLIEIRNGFVYVNQTPLVEPYIETPPLYTMSPIVIPAGHYFLMGDNRNSSVDSHVIGPLPAESIIGKAWLIYWPPKYWGKAPNYSYKEEDVTG